MRNRSIVLACCLVFGLAFSVGCRDAWAQQSTSATYDDWVLVCNNTAGPPPKRSCQISSTTMVQGKNIPFSRVTLEKSMGSKPFKLVAQVPVNVSLKGPVILQADDADPGVSTPFDRCLPGGCFAEFELKDDTVKKYRAVETVGKLSFKDAGGGDIVVPLSFKGFRAAFDALQRE